MAVSDFAELRRLLVGDDPSVEDDAVFTRDSALKTLDAINPPIEIHKHDPVRWVHDRLGYELWSKQRQIVEAVRDHSQVAVHSAHAIGKSLTAAATATWWIDTHPIGEAFVVTTAPTHQQVAAILWREMNRLHARGHLIGRMNLLEWYHGNELIAFGRKPADYDPAAFQGIHARYVLVVMDESCGIPKPLWDAASTLIANEESRFLAIGNPDDPHGEFARVCRPGSGWHVIHVGAEHTPNFTGEPVSELVSASLISKRWVEEKKLSWGIGSALYTSKVEGLFPADSEAGVIPHSWAVACRYSQLPADGRHCAGLDVGGGGDRTVLRERVGPRAGREAIWVEADPMVAVGLIAQQLAEWEIERVVVDVIGIGWGLAGRLKELSRRHNPTDPTTTHVAEVIGFNAAAASRQPARFINCRAELHWEVGRELSRLQAWDLEEVDDDVIAELTESEYEIMDSRGKIKIEAKDQVTGRLGRSPDRADALLMAFWEGSNVDAELPASAQILTGAFYDARFEPTGPTWAGPRRRSVGATANDVKRDELELLRDLQLSRPH